MFSSIWKQRDVVIHINTARFNDLSIKKKYLAYEENTLSVIYCNLHKPYSVDHNIDVVLINDKNVKWGFLGSILGDDTVQSGRSILKFHRN